MKINGSFSIIISTFQGLSYLKLLVNSLKKYSVLDNEILIHVDGSTDGTKEWLESENIPFSYSENLGMCHALNSAAHRATKEYIYWMNDDEVVSPGWDKKLMKWAAPDIYVTNSFIEPFPGSHLVKNFGESPNVFEEEKFVKFLDNYDVPEGLVYGDFTSTGLLQTKKFFEIGGFDIKYDKFGSNDADYLYRIYTTYPKMIFVKVPNVFLYHFSSGTMRKYPELKKDCSQLFQTTHGVNFETAASHLRQRSLELGKSSLK